MNSALRHCDLPPRAVGDGPRDRGYALEVDAAGPVFREAEAGEFFRVAAHRKPDEAVPERADIPAATRLTFWFSALPAGESLESGIFQLAPKIAEDGLRYRVLSGVDGSPPWKPLAPSR